MTRPPVPLGEPDPALFRPALDGLVPYEPGRPVEEVQRELGLDRVVKLASNEGPYGPFPAALEALARSAADLNRYPDGSAYRLRTALAERHDVRFEEVAVAAGADGVIGCLCQSVLEPGNEVVTGWPSFVTYVLEPLKAGATPVRVPLRDDHVDLEAMLGAVTARTKLVFVATPNNPTGTMTGRDELRAFLDAVPEHVLTVVDQAYLEYVDDPEYPDAIEELAKEGRRVAVLRTFSKIYGLAGLRVGYGVAAEPVVRAIRTVQRAFDVATPAQEAALASLDDTAELLRRRDENRTALARLQAILGAHDFQLAGPAVANFVYAEVGDGAALAARLLARGVIVRPLAPFGAPGAVRITVGTAGELALLDEQLGAVHARA